MTDSSLFITIFAATFFANVLVAMMVWGFVARTRLEREGRERETPRGIYIAIFLPMAFGILAMGIVSGKF